MSIDLTEYSGGVLLPVRAQPGSRKNEIRGEQNGALKVSITQVPEKGKANKVLLAFIAKSLGLRKSQITLIAGETSPAKSFLISEITVSELEERIAPFL
ncbi:MAG: DUF167 domain-containing protein [Planctomycetia bacterium]|nr:DUF167 domain-containing protein [Planctomycetia bacterium]